MKGKYRILYLQKPEVRDEEIINNLRLKYNSNLYFNIH